MTVALLLLLYASDVAPEPSRRPWATITKAPSNNHDVTTLQLGTLGPARGANRINAIVYYAKLTYKPLNGTAQVRWADSLTCPALQTALVGLRQVPPPRIDLPGFPGQPGGFYERMILDGTSYSVDFSPYLTFSTNDEDSALAKWTEKALHDLDPCWHAQPPADTDERP